MRSPVSAECVLHGRPAAHPRRETPLECDDPWSGAGWSQYPRAHACGDNSRRTFLTHGEFRALLHLHLFGCITTRILREQCSDYSKIVCCKLNSEAPSWTPATRVLTTGCDVFGIGEIHGNVVMQLPDVDNVVFDLEIALLQFREGSQDRANTSAGDHHAASAQAQFGLRLL